MFFIVTIDATNKHFSPGDTIKGKVHCSIEDSFYTEIRVRLIGEECSYYDGSCNNDVIAKNNSWKAIFLQTQSVIIRSGCFDIGDYSFPFHLSLPKLVPSTYMDKYGYVKFCVRAAITVRGKEAKEDEEKFKVFSPIDLNDVTNLSLAESTHSEALVVNTWWCIGETVRMDVKLRKNAFVLGEVIDVGMKLANNSYLTVSMVKIELYVRITTKVPSLRPVLSTEQLLASDRLADISNYRSSTYTSRLKIPEVVQLSNFQKCTLFSQRCILEVTAEFEKSSKRKLKVEVELILGHIPIGGQKIDFKHTEGEKDLLASPTARPPAYGTTSSSRPSPAPPYPTDSTSTQLPPQVFPHSSNSRVAPLPTDLFQPPKPVPYPPESTFTRQKPLPPEASQPQPNTLDLYPLERQNLPYPPNDRLNSLPMNNSLPPYPIADSCPYPTNKDVTNHPLPIPSSKERIKRSLTLDPPYPNSNSCPYPTGKDGTNHPLPIPSSKEGIKRSLTLDPPYPNSNSCPYPTGKDGTNHPLPIPSSKEGIKRSLILDPPYPNSNSCPYPTDEDETNHRHPIPSSKEKIKSTLTFNPPYPNNNNCPYPIETSGTQLQPRSISNSVSFKETPVPLPSNASFTRGAPYPVTSPPYPTTDHPVLQNSNVAPYPPEKLPSHLTVGFAEFMPMPMPMEYSPMGHRSVGFAVPALRDDEASRPKDTTETRVRPSALSLSDIKTPPIADIKELDDILWADASSVSSDDSYLDARPSDLTIPQLPTPPATDLPLPSLPATNTELVKSTETSVHSDAPSANEEARPSLKKKTKRLQRELAQAI